MRILYVEDNPTDVLLLRNHTRAVNFPIELESVATLGEALAILSSSKPDIVLLDLGLPDSAGMLTLRVLKERFPDVLVIVVTGLANPEAGHEALRFGAQDYIVKDRINADMLGRVLTFALERWRLQSRLEAERSRLSDLLDAIPAFVIVLDVTGTIQRVNRHALINLRYREAELLGLPFGMLFGDGPDAENGEDLAALVQQTGVPGLPRRRAMRTRAGELRFLEFNATPWMVAGAVVGVLISGLDITEREEDRNRIAEQGKLISVMSEAVLVFDSDRRLRFANPAAEALYEIDAQKALGRTHAAVFGESQGFQAQKRLFGILERRPSWQGQATQWLPGSGLSDLLLRGYTFVLPGSQMRGFMFVGQDVTPAVRVRTAARLENRFRRALGDEEEPYGAIAGIIARELGCRLGLLYRLERDGLPHELGRFCRARRGEKEERDDADLLAAASTAAQTHAPVSQRRASGGREVVLAVPILQDGRAIGVLAALGAEAECAPIQARMAEWLAAALAQPLDTHFRQAEAAADAHLRQHALEAAANAIVITGIDGTILWVNAAFTGLTGYASDEVVGRTPSVLKSGRHDSAFYANLWQTISSGSVWRGEIINRKKSGELYSEDMTISPVTDASGEVSHFVAVKQDITERKRFEQEIAHAGKLATLGEMATGVAHELNQPLSVVRMAAQLLEIFAKDGSLTNDILREQTAKLMKNADRARATIDHLRTFGRKGPVELKPLDLNEVISSALELVTEKARVHGVTLHLHFADDLHTILGDQGGLEQVFINLVLNAVDAMDELPATESGPPVREIQILTRNRPRTRQVEVLCKDSGPGMPEDVRRRVFEPFYTTKVVGKGTGLGLSISHGIIRTHGGSIHCPPSKRGAAFRILLPWPAQDPKEGDA